jgi:hypothetical protein
MSQVDDRKKGTAVVVAEHQTDDRPLLPTQPLATTHRVRRTDLVARAGSGRLQAAVDLVRRRATEAV